MGIERNVFEQKGDEQITVRADINNLLRNHQILEINAILEKKYASKQILKAITQMKESIEKHARETKDEMLREELSKERERLDEIEFHFSGRVAA